MEETQDPPLTPQQFSAKIKAKYPQYKDVDDVVLAKKMVEKYPEYVKKVSFGEVKKKDSSVSTPQEAAGVSPTRTTTQGTSSDTEPPMGAQASGGLGGQTGSPFQSIDPFGGKGAVGAIISEQQKTQQPPTKKAAPAVTKKVEPPKEEDYFTGGFGNFLRGVDEISPIGIGDFIDDMARSVSSGYRQGRSAEAAGNLIVSGANPSDEEITQFIESRKLAEEIKPSAEMQDYTKTYEEEGKGFWGVVKGLFKNPTVIPELIVSSLTSMATNTDAIKAGVGTIIAGGSIGATTGATGGSVVPVIGTGIGAGAGAVAGAEAAIPFAFGAASAIVEMGSTFGELLQEELGGKEMSKENVRAILENPDKLQSIRNKAIARGLVIGTIDTVTGKLATGVGAKIMTKSAAKSATGAVTKGAVVRATAAGAGVESVGGSLGEATARGAVGQEMDTSEIALEGLAELPGGIRSTIQARLAKPSYRVNGEKVDADQVDQLINTMTPEQLAATDFKIKNDYTGKEFKIQDKIVTNSIKQEVKKANPDLNEPSLNAITQLEKELKGLEGNKTQTGKDKAAAIRTQIKNIQENQIQEEAVVETAKAEGMSVKAPEKNVFYYYEAKGEKAPTEVPAGYTSMKRVENSEEVKLWNAQKPSEIKPTEEVAEEVTPTEIKPTEVKGISPETSSNVANLTQDGEGNYVFYHTSPTTLETIEPNKYGTNPRNVTSAEEKTAIGRVNGVSMYYPAENVAESIVSGNTHMVKIPESEVYDFNADPLNLIEEARAKFEKEFPGQAFTPNDQFAQVTKIAGDRGFKMVVGEWKDTTRAQTTEPLKPIDVKEMEGNKIIKPFKEDFVSNKDKGFKSIIPESKDVKLKEVYDNINKERNTQNNYDKLYSLREDFPKLSQDEITTMIEESDISQELKDAYAEAVAYEPEQRRTEAPTSKIIPGEKTIISGVEIKYPTKEQSDTRKQERTSVEYVDKAANLLQEEDVDTIKKDLDGDFGLLTAENPMAQPLTENENSELNKKAEEWLKEKGYNPRRVTGKYDQAENSFFVPGLTKSDAVEFAKEFNQESVAHSEGLVYQDGSINPRIKEQDNFSFEDYSPESNYVSIIKTKDGLKTFSVGYDFETKIPGEITPTETKETNVESKGLDVISKGVANMDDFFNEMSKDDDFNSLTEEQKKDLYYNSVSKYSTSQAVDQAAQAPKLIDLKDQNWLKKFVQAFQNKMIRVKDVQEQMEGALGIKILKEANVALKFELLVGKTINIIEDKQKEIFDKSNKESWANRAKKDGVDIDQLGTYMYALHAEERNLANATEREENFKKEVDALNEKIKNAETQSLKTRYENELKKLISGQGKVKLLKEAGSGMTNEQAQEIIDNVEKSGKKELFDKYASEFRDKVIKPSLDDKLKYGLIDQELYDKLQTQYKNYVPLQVVEKAMTKRAGGAGAGASVKGRDIFKAKGSDLYKYTDRYNPIFSSMFEYQNTVARGERNQAAQALINLAELDEKNEVFEVHKPKYTAILDSNGDIKYMLPTTSQKLINDSVELKVDGKPVYVEIKDKAMRDALQSQGIQRGIRGLYIVNSWIRSTATLWNPNFLGTNFLRDYQSALINIQSEIKDLDIKNVTGKIANPKNLKSAGQGIIQDSKGNYDSEWAKLAKEYRDSGGKVSWFQKETLEEYVDSLRKDIEKINKGEKMYTAALNKLGNTLMLAQSVVEQSVRLSTFKALKDAGVSTEEAARAAKNITVNFENKGTWGGLMDSLYLFATAGLSGTVRMATSLSKSKTARTIAGGMFAYGILEAALNSHLGGDDDDDEKIDDGIKERNFVLVNPKDSKQEPLLLPMAYGLNVFKYAGNLTYDVATGRKDATDATSKMFMTIYNQISPLQGPTLSQAVAPTAFDPFVQQSENKNFFGAPIKPEQPKFGAKKKESDLYFESVRPGSLWTAKKLNEWTGGSAMEKGYVDISPEILDHYYDALGGGTGKFISDVGYTGKIAAKEVVESIHGKEMKDKDEFSLRRLPFVKAFFGSKPEKKELQYIYETFERSAIDQLSKEEVTKFTKQLKEAVKSQALDRQDAKQMYNTVMEGQYKIKKYKGVQEVRPADMTKKEYIKFIKGAK